MTQQGSTGNGENWVALLGGIQGQHRPVAPRYLPESHQRFERDVDDLLGDRIRAERQNGIDFWGSITNGGFQHSDGTRAGYTFRAAGDLVAAIRDEGDFNNWYCKGPSGRCAEWIATALKERGWHWEPIYSPVPPQSVN